MLNLNSTASTFSRRGGQAVQRTLSLTLALLLCAGPAAAFSGKGQKNYKRGVEHEAAQQWEKAAEEFALALAAEPSNAEYQLHYRRAVFNASQAFMQQGATLLERGDYVGAYNAFRRANAYDASNQLAASMMERTLSLQLEKSGPARPEPTRMGPTARVSPAVYGGPAGKGDGVDAPAAAPAPRVEQLHEITFSGDLEKFIKYLARQVRLNVVFDRDFPRRSVEVDLQDVTAAQALDYIFLTQGLFYQKLSPRTILVADQVKRPQYQQLVLRTFYLYNVDPNEAKQLIQASIPPQAGRQPVITANKSTNSITVRDTPENIRLVGDILRSIDKERAEVVMDVNIYEVSRADLMQFGNQLGGEASLLNLGGITKGLSVFGGSRDVVTQGVGAVAAPTALGAALVIPATALSALQRKDNTRLVASTQVHAFDGEKSTAHIGQRVPVQTASVAPYGSLSSGGDDKQPGVTQGLFGGNGYPVIQYEKTGLTLEFTPQVFPNLDVQVKMSIKSNDVMQTAGGPALTPTFTERNIEGTARIQNSRTMMIASVAQNSQSRGRQGLPLLGLLPVLGRAFTAPRNSNTNTDIVIAVTPHVMRAPSVTPQDEQMRPSGTLQTPTSETLEAMLNETYREEQFAAARVLPRNARVELPESAAITNKPTAAVNASANKSAAPPANEPAVVETYEDETAKAEAPTFVPAPRELMSQTATPPAAPKVPPTSEAVYKAPASSAPARQISNPAPAVGPWKGSFLSADSARSAASFRLVSDSQPMRVGDKRQLKLLLKTDAPLGLVAATLRFDPRVISVISVNPGGIFPVASASCRASVTPEGLVLVSFTPAAGVSELSGAGVLLVVEVQALAEGDDAFKLDADELHVLAADGRKVLLKTTGDRVAVVR
ncbi:MAG TPA: secretin N-terminal domain-containing protein [Pyrinomonadaceae bacterium]|jgi:general secretion pathway protein D|nr:secretin N-terminal domain-containing protein [Pyrinomonadaceae bacterium]